MYLGGGEEGLFPVPRGNGNPKTRGLLLTMSASCHIRKEFPSSRGRNRHLTSMATRGTLSSLLKCGLLYLDAKVVKH